MEALVTQLDWATVLDGAAMACSVLLILFMLIHRRRYGRIVLTTRRGKGQAPFADQVSVHMMAQQSQKAYDNLQESLAREFESLRLMGTGRPSQVSVDDHGPFAKMSMTASRERQRRYRMAEELLRRGEDAGHVVQQCGLMEGEVQLLHRLQALAAEQNPRHTSESRTALDVYSGT